MQQHVYIYANFMACIFDSEIACVEFFMSFNTWISCDSCGWRCCQNSCCCAQRTCYWQPVNHVTVLGGGRGRGFVIRLAPMRSVMSWSYPSWTDRCYCVDWATWWWRAVCGIARSEVTLTWISADVSVSVCWCSRRYQINTGVYSWVQLIIIYRHLFPQNPHPRWCSIYSFYRASAFISRVRAQC